MKEVKKNNKMLTQEENIELIKEYRNTNDKEILDKLIEGNYNLIRYVAVKYYNYYHSIELDDLIQECSYAMYMAIKKYDLEKNQSIKFITYATRAMTNGLINMIQSTDKIIRIPNNLEVLNREYTKLLSKRLKEDNSVPTDEEVKQELNISEEKLNILKRVNNIKTISSNITIDANDEVELEELFSYEEKGYVDYENYIDSKILIKNIKDALKPEEYYIFYRYYLSPEKILLKDIGNELLVSKAYIGFVIKEIRNKVKTRLNRNIISGEKMSIKEVESIDLNPISPKEIASFYELKKNCDSTIYYFIYNGIKNGYTKKEFKQELVDLSDLEIEQIIEKCDKVKEQYFNLERQEIEYKKLKINKSISEIYKLNILPDSKKEEIKVKRK